MAKKPETVFKERIAPQIAALPHTWVLKTQEKSRRGVPDLLICIKGKFIAIELKKDGEEPDALQQYTLMKIAAAQGVSMVANPKNWDTVFSYLQKLAKGRMR